MHPSHLRSQAGVSLIAVILMMLVMAVMGSVLLSSVGTENTSTVGQMRGTQSLYVAEGGIEFGERYMTENGNWYFSTVDPLTIVTNRPLGAGTFTDTVSLPATALSRNLGGGAGNQTVCVFTRDRFPAPSVAVPTVLQIEDEIVTCTSTGVCAGALPAFTSCARGGGLGISNHAIGVSVYPVIRWSSWDAATSTISFTGDASKFLASGTIQVWDPALLGTIEQIRYNGISGGAFQGVVRAVNGTASPSPDWTAVAFITPLQVRGVAPFPDIQALITAGGVVGSANRVVQTVVER